MKTALVLIPGQMTLAELRTIWQNPLPLALPDTAQAVMETAAATIQRIVEKGDAACGINTGLGKLAKTRIPDEQLELLQRNLILSHCVGTGEPMSEATVRLVMVMKAVSLARGYCGVRPVVVHTLMAWLNTGITPLIPIEGSAGASGDLTPLSHMSMGC